MSQTANDKFDKRHIPQRYRIWWTQHGSCIGASSVLGFTAWRMPSMFKTVNNKNTILTQWGLLRNIINCNGNSHSLGTIIPIYTIS